ncbi:hypothetical protein [Kribbella kalugense]|uniref:Uncharacterized protein n=1 Tax=Kribbella kalugense TaxID=2512221 RepID=A0A4R7ZVU0_9ACTN|nr:hypothetical protein [Kribbella kalugense]TDW22217.1 hypothetical protein EV650_1054 [Kribbella kalugense]
MGTTAEEQAALDRINQESIAREAARLAAEDAARKAAEQKQGNMVAGEPAVANWPDDGFQAAPQSGMDKVAGALRVGQAGDVAFARDLLNSGQAPLGGVSKPEGTAAGAQESGAGSRAAKPALGLG